MIEETYLPQCLAIGIRAEEFWNLNIRSLRPFLKAEEIKFQQKNREMHLQGAYIYEAVSVALGNALRRQGDKVLSYCDKPYEFMKEEELKKRKQQAETEKLKAAFQAFAEQTRMRLENGN